MAGKKLKVYKKIKWDLHGMTKEKLEEYEVGHNIDSPSTEIAIGDNITEWSLRFNPGGADGDSKNHIGLLLKLNNSDSNDFKVKYKMGIVGTRKVLKGSHNGEEFEDGYGSGSDKFLKREKFSDPKKGFLTDGSTDGKLIIFCKLTITARKVSESKVAADSLTRGLLNHFKEMLEGEAFADLEIETYDGKILKAHKHILAARSSAFKAKLAGIEGNVLVPEDASVMKQVLRFVYHQEVENLNEIAHDLVFAAENYELKELKKLCIDSMIASLTTKNVLPTLLTADRLTKSKLLKDKCFDMIASNFSLWSTSDAFKKLDQKVLVEFTLHAFGKDKDTINI